MSADPQKPDDRMDAEAVQDGPVDEVAPIEGAEPEEPTFTAAEVRQLIDASMQQVFGNTLTGRYLFSFNNIFAALKASANAGNTIKAPTVAELVQKAADVAITITRFELEYNIARPAPQEAPADG